MLNGMIGKKVGMTQIFTQDGRCVPVTVIKAGPCTILQKKTTATDGYNALQLGFEEVKKPSSINRPMRGHFRKAAKGAFRKIVEFRTDEVDSYEVGQAIDLDAFQEGDRVAVTGESKGRGFQGVVKRHGFAGGRETHGSMNHRGPGAIGQCAWPARVFKGHRMAGQMGNERVTIRNLEIMQIDKQNNLLLIKGSVPGAKNNFVLIRRK